MRYCVFADIHGNLEALEAVIADARKQGAERYVCVGDIVGYGASPSECIDRVQGLTTQVVGGNHDCAVVGRTDLEYFNLFARDAVVWTRAHISPQEKAYLRDLPLVLKLDDLTLVHATVHEPERFGYIESELAARLSFQALNGALAFVGHSHVPVAFFYEQQADEILFTRDQEIVLDHAAKAIINVGSVGQPRDDDPRAAYAVYDTDKRKIIIRRIPYDIESAKRKIIAAGLPEVLALRLTLGR